MFYFQIIFLNFFRGDAVSEGLIRFSDNPTNFSEGVLEVAGIIDREDVAIVALQGKLPYTITVSGAAGNKVEQKVVIFS